MADLMGLESSKAWLFACGVVGSALSFRFVPGMNRKQKLLSAGSSGAMAALMSPLVAFLWGIENNPSAVAGIGCGIGIFGLSICDSLFQKIKSGDLMSIFRGR